MKILKFKQQKVLEKLKKYENELANNEENIQQQFFGSDHDENLIFIKFLKTRYFTEIKLILRIKNEYFLMEGKFMVF